jgi:hypothetical protein
VIIRFPSGVDLRADKPKQSLWERFRQWLNPPVKVEVFKVKNPTHWKLSRIRRKARGSL